MTFEVVRRTALAALLLGTGLATGGLGTAAQAATFMPSQFVVFGDSFLDAGSVNRFTGGAFAPASAGFWQGRFSDGPNWIDYLGFANFGSATQKFNDGLGAGQLPPPFQLGATNFAIGGARASGDDVQAAGTIPGLNSQLLFYQGYLALTGQSIDPDALYVINFGNNDVNYIQSIQADPALSPAQKASVIESVQINYVNNIINTALVLAVNGADHILIAGVPNPLEAEGQALQARLLSGPSSIFPGGLQGPVVQTVLAQQGADLDVFDYFGFFTSLQADPTAFGLPADLNFTTPCLAVETPSPNIDCRNYLSFDGIHVTTGVQRAIAIQVAQQVGIQSVPEPGTWGLMIAGFGAVGFAMRRRRGGMAGLPQRSN